MSAVEASVFVPLAPLRNSGRILLTTFGGLIETWRRQHGGEACIYDGAR